MAVDAVWDKLVSGCISLQTGKIQGIPLRPNDLVARYLQCLWAIRPTLFFAALKYQGNFWIVSRNFVAPNREIECTSLCSILPSAHLSRSFFPSFE
jgi:hypothetical protein